ncbi:MAG: SDR family oxidoreductase, partial [Actinomycetota bacterium]|nr:SDR family oxidoreductase [Actinomycetota bacterium]
MNLNTFNPGRVLVTGGASGLGAAVVSAVLEAGGTPVVLDRDIRNVAAAKAFEVDVSDREAVTAAVVQAAETLGGLDAVVTAAGTDRCGRLDDVPADEWEKVISVNLLGTVSVVRAALPYLLASHGRVVTIASTLAKRGVSDATAY